MRRETLRDVDAIRAADGMIFVGVWWIRQRAERRWRWRRWTGRRFVYPTSALSIWYT